MRACHSCQLSKLKNWDILHPLTHPLINGHEINYCEDDEPAAADEWCRDLNVASCSLKEAQK